MQAGLRRTLVLGGARSGKSARAEALAAQTGKQVVYIATAAASDGDAEMRARIARHRAQRPAHWTTVEEPLMLGAALAQWCAPQRVVLVDCLTLWLNNLMFGDMAPGSSHPDVGEIALPLRFHAERAAFLQALEGAAGELILVSNEVGMGIVPWGAVSRSFADEAGRLNQAVATRCEVALLMAAGLPLFLKGAQC